MENRIKNLLDEANRELQFKRDLYVNPSRVFVNPKNGRVHMEGAEFELNDWSVGQLCNRLTIPTKYYKTLTPDLQAANANHWIEKQDREKDWMFRTRQNDGLGLVRGILSERYSPYDDHEILDIANKLVGDRDGVKVEMAYRDDTGLHVRVTFDDLTAAVGKTIDGKPDLHRVGFHLSNSEVGARSIRIQPMVYRLVCTNGLMAWRTDGEVFEQRHVYLRHHEMEHRVAEALVSSVKAGDEVLDKLMEAKETPVADPFKAIEALAAGKKYSQKFAENVKTEWTREPEKNAFGVIQAFTAAARALKPDDRLEIETDAGKMLRNLKTLVTV